MLELLWPAPLQVGSSWKAASPDDRQLIVLPNAQHPKLVLPRRPLAATAAAIRNYNTFVTGHALTALRGIAVATRLGVLDVVPGIRISIAGQGEGIDDHLRRTLERDLAVALYVGPKRAVQKPVIQLISLAGETFGFAKLGINPLTEALVGHEYRALARLHDARLTTLEVPAVLHLGKWQGHTLLVQAAIPASRDVTEIKRLLPAATRELAGVDGITEQSWLASTYRARLAERSAALATVPHADLLELVLRAVDGRLAGTNVLFGSWHGDWAPWNVTSRNGRLVAWDWETFENDVPYGLDAAHNDITARAIIGGLAPDAAYADLLLRSMGR